MESLRLCTEANIPILLYMLAGYIAKRANLIKEEDVVKFNKFTFTIFLSINIFNSIYKSSWQSAIRPALILYTIVGILAMYMFSVWYANRFVEEKFQRGAVVQGLFRTNFVLIGLTIAETLVPYEDVASIAVLSAVTSPLFNVLAIVSFSSNSEEKIIVPDVLKSIFTNPLTIASVAGILCMLLQIRFPVAIENSIDKMSGVAMPLMLFLSGAFFKFDSLNKYRCRLVAVTILRLIAIPAVFLTMGYYLGFRGMSFVALVGLFASSSTASSFTVAMQMNGDAELAGDIAALTTVLCPFTIFLWTLLFKSISAF